MGCQETINICKYLAQSFKNMSVLEWPIPDGSSHSEMMVRELLLKINGRWDYPYKEEELCHCRYVKTSAVDESILGGAHNSHQVTLLTGAASACSACQVHIEKIIQYRLKASA
jgi:bacterioferritin-associated ferredoxin